MKSVSSQLTEASKKALRRPLGAVSVAWEREVSEGVFFTIGTSTIGGDDIIKSSGSDMADIFLYNYTDETNYLISLELEQYFNEPLASYGRAICDIVLSNVSGRFDPDGVLAGYIKTARPIKASIGFNSDVTKTVQKFIGELQEYPEIKTKDKTITLRALDYAQTIWNYPVEDTEMYTDKRSDELIQLLLESAGVPDDQMSLEPGVNIIPFAFFETGQTIGDIIAKICEAEMGRFYLNEEGIFVFENREHWGRVSPTPFLIDDSFVIDESDISKDDIINSVEIKGYPRAVQDNQIVWQLDGSREIKSGETLELWTNYDDPMYSVDTPSGGGATSTFTANATSDGTGVDLTASIVVSDIDNFAKSSKITFTNNASVTAFLTELKIWGEPAKITSEIYRKETDATSISEFSEKVLKIDNDYIQTNDFARAMAKIILEDRKSRSSYKKLTIRGLPQLQLGDLVSRNDETYNISRIKTKLSGNSGLLQEITLIKKTIETYFTIGVSTINGMDKIAP